MDTPNNDHLESSLALIESRIYQWAALACLYAHENDVDFESGDLTKPSWLDELDAALDLNACDFPSVLKWSTEACETEQHFVDTLDDYEPPSWLVTLQGDIKVYRQLQAAQEQLLPEITNEDIETCWQALSFLLVDLQNLSECNPHYSYRLARALLLNGKSVADTTLGELVAINERESKAYTEQFYPELAKQKATLQVIPAEPDFRLTEEGRQALAQASAVSC